VDAPPILRNWKAAPRPGPVTLRGRYVTLEPLDPDRHVAALWEAVRGHDELWTWLAKGPFRSCEALAEHIAKWREANDAILLAILPREEGPAVAGQPRDMAPEGQARGWASFMRIEPEHGVIEVGNILLSPALQKTRAATEAMYLMASHVFDHLGYRRYEWKCNALNEPSRRAAQRLGFTFEGIFRQHMVIKGRNRDTAWYAMLDREWPARKHAFETWLSPSNFDEHGRQLSSLQKL
jgi:RimJ/RimL family protein N-acetyltransferase